MRPFSTFEKLVIIEIIEMYLEKPDSIVTLTNILAKLNNTDEIYAELDPTRKCTLYINSNGESQLPENGLEELNNFGKKLIYTTKLIEYLENQGLVFSTRNDFSYDLGRIGTKCIGDHYIAYPYNNSLLEILLDKYGFVNIYPTEELISYYHNDFQTPDEIAAKDQKSFNSQQIITNWLLLAFTGISVIVSIVSLFSTNRPSEININNKSLPVTMSIPIQIDTVNIYRLEKALLRSQNNLLKENQQAKILQNIKKDSIVK